MTSLPPTFAERFGQTVFVLLAIAGIGFGVLAIGSIVFPGGSGEWAGYGVAIGFVFDLAIVVVMFALVFTQRKGQRRKYFVVTAIVLALPLLAMLVRPLKNYLWEVFILRPLLQKSAPAAVQLPSAASSAPAVSPPRPAPPPCIAESDPAYALTTATRQLVDVRDRRAFWEARLQQDAQLRERHPGGYEQLLADTFTRYREAGGEADSTIAVRLRAFPCQPAGVLPQILPLPPQRPQGAASSPVNATRSLVIPADIPR